MSPVATDTRPTPAQAPLKNGLNGKSHDVDTFDPSDLQESISSFNPFYSPPGDQQEDADYEYDKYKVRNLLTDNQNRIPEPRTRSRLSQ